MGRAREWLKGTQPEGAALFATDYRATYFALRSIIFLVGFVLPFGLLGLCSLYELSWTCLGSMSASYWLPTTGEGVDYPLRVWFVGALWAIGFGLLAYRGYTPWENRLLNIAGVAAICVATIHMAWTPNGDEDPLRACYLPPHDGLEIPLGHFKPVGVHYVSAVVFFVMMAFTMFFCSRATLHVRRKGPHGSSHQVLSHGEQRIFKLLYGLFAMGMLVLPMVAIWLKENGHQIYAIEWIGSASFALYWLTKTFELHHSGVERQPFLNRKPGPTQVSAKRPQLEVEAGNLTLLDGA